MEEIAEQGVMSLVIKMREYRKQYPGQGMPAAMLMAVS